MQIKKFSYLIFPLILFINCFGLKFQKNDITPNDWSEKSIRIANLEDSYKRKHRFNKVFSKFSSKRFIPYYRFIDKTFSIVGSYNQGDENYIIIKDKNGKFFKISQKNKKYNKDPILNFLVFEENFENAKQLIDTKIWLNDVWDAENFITKFPNSFYTFQSVEVKDVIGFQNSDIGYPIWLKVLTEKGEDAIVRYNQQGVRVGIKDHYFTSDPLPLEWGTKILQKIKNRKADIGMSSKQVRIAIGYPDEINSTSSRHGVSEQWIYFLLNKKNYYQFEYDKLVYINN
ncbi:MAG: hypothetical protein CMF99_08550 [Candidatus Marinimicrobia bacterium]|nr:hypothetical protein [Candidatus Neomarinimicrobiota bacterium]|tara:strand:+ start:7372 stop:8229 length:858 start_codon:yes stop_codon:yes gene_type:complete